MHLTLLHVLALHLLDDCRAAHAAAGLPAGLGEDRGG